MASPIDPGARFERVDQGVDYNQAGPYRAIGPGRVYAVTSGFAGGTGKAVYYRLDKPILVGHRAYQELYVAETTPLVKVGQRVKAGQPLASGGAAELGFASGTAPAAPLVGGLGAGTQPSQEGYDFLELVKNGGDHVPTPGTPTPKPGGPYSPPPGIVTPGGTSGVLGPTGKPPFIFNPGGSAGIAYPPGTIANAKTPLAPTVGPNLYTPANGVDDLGMLAPPEATQPQLLMPGQGGIADQLNGDPGITSRLWDLVQQEQNLSSDTVAYVQNISGGMSV